MLLRLPRPGSKAIELVKPPNGPALIPLFPFLLCPLMLGTLPLQQWLIQALQGLQGQGWRAAMGFIGLYVLATAGDPWVFPTPGHVRLATRDRLFPEGPPMGIWFHLVAPPCMPGHKGGVGAPAAGAAHAATRAMTAGKAALGRVKSTMGTKFVTRHHARCALLGFLSLIWLGVVTGIQ